MPDQIRILLVDDHAVLRQGVRRLLEHHTDFNVVGEAADGEQAVERARALRPHVVVMDLAMPGIGGLEATRRIVELGQGVRVLALTAHDEEEFLLPMLQAGGSGYVSKGRDFDELADAIRTVARDQVFLYPSGTRLLLQQYRQGTARTDHSLVGKLSRREREVLTLTAQGFSSSEIGARLGISPKTVDTYRGRIMEKLGLHRRSELVRFALHAGLLMEP